MQWTPLHFGKYKGKTLPQVVLVDPDWFFWAVEENTFKSAALRAEAADIQCKAIRIRIPTNQPANSTVEYVFQPGSGKLADVTVVPADRPCHEGASPTRRADYFDLSVPRKIAVYDKTGDRIIVEALRRYVLPGVRLTRARCEAFFDDSANFA